MLKQILYVYIYMYLNWQLKVRNIHAFSKILTVGAYGLILIIMNQTVISLTTSLYVISNIKIIQLKVRNISPKAET